MVQQQTQSPEISARLDSLLSSQTWFDSFASAPLPVGVLLANLSVGAVLALILRWHFGRYASTLSNRQQFAQTFPLILLTTLLIISIVKSSLALSLGLVGALSIVRFRTPIKEPEELAYLFLAIAMGLGLGANQTVATVVASVFILVLVAIVQTRRRGLRNQNLYLTIDWSGGATNASTRLDTLNAVIGDHSSKSDLRRFDVRDDVVEATYLVEFENENQLSHLVKRLQRKDEQVAITFIDQKQLPPV